MKQSHWLLTNLTLTKLSSVHFLYEFRKLAVLLHDQVVLFFFFSLPKLSSRPKVGGWTQHPEIKSYRIHQLSQPGALQLVHLFLNLKGILPYTQPHSSKGSIYLDTWLKTFPREICSLISNDKDRLSHIHMNTMQLLLKTMF